MSMGLCLATLNLCCYISSCDNQNAKLKAIMVVCTAECLALVTCCYLVHRSVVVHVGHSKFCAFVFDLQVVAENHWLVLRDWLPWELWQLMHNVLTSVIQDYKLRQSSKSKCFFFRTTITVWKRDLHCIIKLNFKANDPLYLDCKIVKSTKCNFVVAMLTATMLYKDHV